MKVFISWSGTRSRAVAELLRDWIKCVLQATRPWISTRDIDRGALWFSEISDQLKDTSVGVVCLTNENKNKPWILFEAGALAKGLSSSRVCTFLVDLEPTDLENPLAQFNHTVPTKEGLWSLVQTLNISLESNQLDERILQQVFQTYWPQFEMEFASILEKNPVTEQVEPRSEENLLSEILENTRFLGNRILQLEKMTGLQTSSSPLQAADARYKELLDDISTLVEAGFKDETIITSLKKDYGTPRELMKKYIYRVRSGTKTDVGT